MGVEVDLIGIIGIKKPYNEFGILKNKNLTLTESEKEYFNNIVYEDYLPDNYIADSDGMSCEYSFVGKKLFVLEDGLYNGLYCTVDKNKLENDIKEVYTTLKSMGIKCEESDIKLHIFTHFY